MKIVSESDNPDAAILTDSIPEIKCGQCAQAIDVSDLQQFTQIQCPKCGTSQTVPAKFGPFFLIELLGMGGMGGVYHAYDAALDRHVAIKVMLRSLGENAEFVERFKKEAKAAAALNHSNVVQIYSFGQEKGQPYIVMEMVSGDRFDKLVSDGKQLAQGLVARIGVHIAQGLGAANEAGMLHGDIKPENILLDEKGIAKLVDFGLASLAGSKAEDGGVWGTPYYIAPEKVRGQKGDARSDMYSLGATLYHALAAKPPFDGKTPIAVVKARLAGPPTELNILRPDINPALQAVISRMLQPQPSARHPTHASLVGDLKRALQLVGPPKKGTVGNLKKKTGKLMVTKKRKSAPGAAVAEDSGRATKSMPAGIRINKVARTSARPTQSGHKAIVVGKAAKAAKAGKAAPLVSSARGGNISARRAGASGDSREGRAPPVKKKSAAPVVMTIIVLLLLLGGGVFGLMYHKKEKRREAYIEAMALKDAKEAAKDMFEAIEKIGINMVAMTKRAKEMGKDARGIAGMATGADRILGRTPRSSQTHKRNAQGVMVDEQGREMPAGIGSSPSLRSAPKPSGLTRKPRIKTRLPAQPAEAPDQVGSQVDEHGREMPAGIVIPAHMRKKSKPAPLQETPVQEFSAKQAATEVGAVVDDMGREIPGGIVIPSHMRQQKKPTKKASEPVVITPAASDSAPGGTVTSALVADEMAAPVWQPQSLSFGGVPEGEKQLRELGEYISSLTDKIEGNGNRFEHLRANAETEKGTIDRAYYSLDTQMPQNSLVSMLADGKLLEENTMGYEQQAKIACDDLLTYNKKKKQEAVMLKEVEAARLKAEKEKRKAAELARKVAAEKIQAEEARQGLISLVAENKFKEIADNLAGRIGGYQTEEGKQALQNIIDRYKQINAFKEWLMGRMNAKPAKWAWKGKADIMSADAEFIKITTGKIPWVRIDAKQMIGFFEYYLANSQRIPHKEKATQYYGVAAFCYETGATDQAAKYANKAIDMWTHFRGEAERMMPDLPID